MTGEFTQGNLLIRLDVARLNSKPLNTHKKKMAYGIGNPGHDF